MEAFPITIYCKQISDNKRCITKVVEAYTAIDAEAKTRTLFQYERTSGGEVWRRVGAISPRIVEVMRNNGADEAQIARFSSKPSESTPAIAGMRGGDST